eukprot:7380392-Prymnesium_polylepis.2
MCGQGHLFKGMLTLEWMRYVPSVVEPASLKWKGMHAKQMAHSRTEAFLPAAALERREASSAAVRLRLAVALGESRCGANSLRCHNSGQFASNCRCVTLERTLVGTSYLVGCHCTCISPRSTTDGWKYGKSLAALHAPLS